MLTVEMVKTWVLQVMHSVDIRRYSLWPVPMLGEKWIEQKFQTQLERIRHEHQKELEAVRHEIQKMFSRISKIHEKSLRYYLKRGLCYTKP